MRRLFNIFKKEKELPESTKDDVLQIWLDDISQIELLPYENIDFIKDEIKRINKTSGSENGLIEIHIRGSQKSPLINNELRIDYLESLLSSRGFFRCNRIQLEKGSIKPYNESKYKAYRSKSMIIYFEEEEEFVKTLWIQIKLIVSVSEFRKLENILYDFGEGLDLLLMDWEKLDIIDLKNRKEIGAYLMEMFK